jgi:hypothetical protein
MTNPDIASQNRRGAAPRPVFKLPITIENPRRFPVHLKAMKRLR